MHPVIYLALLWLSAGASYANASTTSCSATDSRCSPTGATTGRPVKQTAYDDALSHSLFNTTSANSSRSTSSLDSSSHRDSAFSGPSLSITSTSSVTTISSSSSIASPSHDHAHASSSSNFSASSGRLPLSRNNSASHSHTGSAPSTYPQSQTDSVKPKQPHRYSSSSASALPSDSSNGTSSPLGHSQSSSAAASSTPVSQGFSSSGFPAPSSNSSRPVHKSGPSANATNSTSPAAPPHRGSVPDATRHVPSSGFTVPSNHTRVRGTGRFTGTSVPSKSRPTCPPSYISALNSASRDSLQFNASIPELCDACPRAGHVLDYSSSAVRPFSEGNRFKYASACNDAWLQYSSASSHWWDIIASRSTSTPSARTLPTTRQLGTVAGPFTMDHGFTRVNAPPYDGWMPTSTQNVRTVTNPHPQTFTSYSSACLNPAIRGQSNITMTFPNHKPDCSIGPVQCAKLSKHKDPTGTSIVPICGTNGYHYRKCHIVASRVKVLYWPHVTPKPAHDHLHSSKRHHHSGSEPNATITQAPSTIVSGGQTFVSPSIYISVEGLGAITTFVDDLSITSTASNTAPASNYLIPMRQDALSSVVYQVPGCDGLCGDHLQSIFSSEPTKHLELPVTAQPYHPATLSLEPSIPVSAYFWGKVDAGYNLGRTPLTDIFYSPQEQLVWDDYLPQIAAPEELRNLGPDGSWMACGLGVGGIYDPPIALSAATALATPILTPAGMAPTPWTGPAPASTASSAPQPTAAPAPSGQGTDNNDSPSGSASFVNDGGVAASAVPFVTPTLTNDGPDGSPTPFDSTTAEQGSSLDGGNNSPQNAASGGSGASASNDGVDNQQNSGIFTGNSNNAEGSGEGTEYSSNGATSGTDSVLGQVSSNDGSSSGGSGGSGSDGQSPSAGGGSSHSSGSTGSGSQDGGISSYASALVNAVVAAAGAVPAAMAEVMPIPLPTGGSDAPTENNGPSSAPVFATQTTITDLFGENIATAALFAGHTVVAAGPAATINNNVVSLASEGQGLVLNGATVATFATHNEPTQGAAAGGSPVTAYRTSVTNSNSQVTPAAMVYGQTLVAGDSELVHLGHTYTFSPDENIVVDGTATVSLQTLDNSAFVLPSISQASPTSTAISQRTVAVSVASTQTITAVEEFETLGASPCPSAAVISSQTIRPGLPGLAFSSHIISLASDGNFIVDGTHTATGSLISAPSQSPNGSAEMLAAMTLDSGSRTMTASESLITDSAGRSSTVVVVDGSTATVGQVMTMSGSTLTAMSNGIMMNGSLVTFSATSMGAPTVTSASGATSTKVMGTAGMLVQSQAAFTGAAPDFKAAARHVLLASLGVVVWVAIC